MKTKCLFFFVLLMTLTGGHKGEAAAANNFAATAELSAYVAQLVAPHFIQAPVDFTVKVGQTVWIEARIEGIPFPDVQVFKNGKELFPSDRINISVSYIIGIVTVTISNIVLSDKAIYSIKISNDAGAVMANSKLTVT